MELKVEMVEVIKKSEGMPLADNIATAFHKKTLGWIYFIKT